MEKNADADPDQPQNTIRPYNTSELAALYNVSTYTIRKWLKPFGHKIGKRNGYTYTTLQVIIIIECLGPPSSSK